MYFKIIVWLLKSGKNAKALRIKTCYDGFICPINPTLKIFKTKNISGLDFVCSWWDFFH